jgi:hypothetical protein
MFRSASIIFIYFGLLVLGPIIFIGKIPLASYHLVFLFILSGALLIHLKTKKTNVYFPLYFKFYLVLLALYLLTYVFNFFELGYIADFRDLIIIFTPIQYIILISLLYFSCQNENIIGKDKTVLFHGLIKLNLYLLPIVGVIAICQMLDVFGSQEILAKYYGKTNVAVWRQYFISNPRASATLNLEPNSLGLYAAFSLVMFHVFYKDVKLGKITGMIIYFFGLLALMLSGSFTGVFIYVLVSTIYLFKYKKIGVRVVILIATITFIVSLVFAENIDSAIKRQKLDQGNIVPSSFKARINNAWGKAFTSFEEEFVNGIGPSAIELDYSADNDFLDKFLRFGLIGGLANLFFVMFLILYPLFKRKGNMSTFHRKLYFFAFLITLCFALASITGSAFKAKRLAEIFWIFYSLPFIYSHLLYNPKVSANEE